MTAARRWLVRFWWTLIAASVLTTLFCTGTLLMVLSGRVDGSAAVAGVTIGLGLLATVVTSLMLRTEMNRQRR